MAQKFLNGIHVTSDADVTGKLSADNFELTSGADHLTITESSGDWTINNEQQNNGITIYDGTGGVDINYAGTSYLNIDINGVSVAGNIDFYVDTDTLYVDSTNENVGINSTGNTDYSLYVNGKIASNNYVIASLGNGGVALTHNDGYGNANVTFNHVSGTPEQNGNSFRIETNTDSSTNAAMTFEIAEGVSSGVAISTTEVFRLEPSGPRTRATGGGVLYLERNDTTIIDGNPLGRIRFGGDDPVDGTFNYGAEIRANAAGTWATDNYPTELHFYTKFDDTDLLALRLDKNQNTYLSGSLNFPSGGNIYNSTGTFIIQNNAGAQFDVKSNQGVRLYIDANGDDTVHKFEILSNTDTYASGNVVASVDQSGNATFAGQVTIPETPTADAHAASKKYVDDQITSGVDVAKRLEVTVKNISGGQLTKGTVVHASPSATPPSGNVIEVVAADANDAALMPALGVLNETIEDEAEGAAVMFGSVTGIDTSGFSVGDELYVSTTLGTLTETKPTAINEQVQKIGVVIKSHASSGHIKVFGAGRSNDVPNFVDRDITFGSAVNISSDLSAASAIDYPLIISSKDDDNNINQLGGEGVGIQFKIAGNDDTVPGNSFLGASIAAIRESAVDTDSSTALGFFVTQNDETLDEAFRVNSDGDFGIGTGSTITGKFNSYITAARQITHNGNGGDLSVISDNGTTPVFYVKGTGTADLVNVFDNTTEVFTIKDGGYVGLGQSNPTSRLHIHHTEDDTDQDIPGSFAMEIDGNFTGTNSITAGFDREQGGLYIDVDSSSTGGDTSDEHRVFGIYSDTRFNGTADQAISIYGIAEQNATTNNTSAYVIGIQGWGVTDGGADFSINNIAGVWGEVSMQDATPVTNSYGGYFKNTISSSRTGATTTTYGSYSEVEINSSSTFTNIKGKRIAIDVNTDNFTASTIQGLEIVYTGISDIPAATNTWSIYSSSDIQSYHKGNFGIDRSLPEVALHVGPTSLISAYDPTETVIAVSDTTNGAGIVIRGGSPYTWFDCSGGGTGQIFLDSESFDIYSGTPVDRTGGAGDTKGTSRFHIGSDGYIGINNNSPDSRLHVVQTVDREGIKISSDAVQPELTLIDDATGDYFGIGHNRSSSLLQFEHNNTSVMYLSHDGNLGIGTNDIDGKLHVVGTYGHWKINGYGGMYFNNSSDTDNTRYIHPRSNGNLSIGRGLTANLTSTDPNKYFTTATDQLTIEADGGIIFNDYGSGSNTGTVAYNLAVDSSGNIIENSANTRSIFVATSTDTTTNVNATTTINWNSEDIKDSGYTHSDTTDPDEITITQAGTYKIYSAITYDTTVERVNVVLEILVNGTATNARGAGGYVRSASSHNTGTTIVEDYVTISANDVIKIQTIQEAASGTANLISNQSKLIIEKLTGLTLSTTNANTLGGLGATDFVAVAGDTMTGALSINEGGAAIKKTNSSSFETVLTIEELADEGSTETLIIKNSNDRDIGIKMETGGGFHHIWQDSNSDDSLIISAAGYNRDNDSTIIFNQDHSVVIPNGRLGINELTPNCNLDVKGTVNTTIIAASTLGDGGGSANRGLALKAVTDGGELITVGASTNMYLNTANNLYLENAGSTKVTMLASGNFGIGTNDPQVKLHVNDTSSGEYLRVGTGGLRELRFSTYSTVSDHAGHKIDASSSNGEFAFAIAGDAKMYIKSSGKVGIDSDDPKSKLDVDGGVKIGDDTDTASADKVGTMRYRTGTEYVEVNGKNLVYNGDFRNGTSNWSFGAGWAVSNGGATVSTDPVTTDVRQTLSYVANISTATKFRYRFEITDITAGSLRLFVAKPTFTQIANVNAVGVYEYVVEVGTGSNGYFYLYSTSSSGSTFQGTVTNVSVVEVTEENASYADMCMQTGSATYEWVNIVQNIY